MSFLLDTHSRLNHGTEIDTKIKYERKQTRGQKLLRKIEDAGFTFHEIFLHFINILRYRVSNPAL